MRRESYSGKKQIVALDGIPLRGISDADESILATQTENTFDDAEVDLAGKNGCHVENASTKGTITVTLKFSSPDHATLTALYKARAPISAVTIKDIGTNAAGVIGRDCRIKKAPDYKRGKKPGDVVYEFSCVELIISQDGPRIIAV